MQPILDISLNVLTLFGFLILLSLVDLNLTIISIAHRLSTIKQSDLIIVLEDGKIVVRGNHTSLLKNKGLYYQLYNDLKPESL